MKIEHGVMVVKNGKAWGIAYEDGHVTEYGWIEPEDAPIHDPNYCKKTTDVTWPGSPYMTELESGKLVKAERITEVKLFNIEL